jgi:Subunit 21 of Mediator complex
MSSTRYFNQIHWSGTFLNVNFNLSSKPSTFATASESSSKALCPASKINIALLCHKTIVNNSITLHRFPGFDRTSSPPQNQQEDFAQLFAQLIARTAKDIDTIIESLPNEDSSQELQIQSLRQLEIENADAADRLEEIVRKGEQLLERIQEAQANIFKAIQTANNLS